MPQDEPSLLNLLQCLLLSATKMVSQEHSPVRSSPVLYIERLYWVLALCNCQGVTEFLMQPLGTHSTHSFTLCVKLGASPHFLWQTNVDNFSKGHVARKLVSRTAPGQTSCSMMHIIFGSNGTFSFLRRFILAANQSHFVQSCQKQVHLASSAVDISIYFVKEYCRRFFSSGCALCFLQCGLATTLVCSSITYPL